ncbi:MAG: flotillin domain-containing protein, partial [Paracoccaceae bacterium]
LLFRGGRAGPSLARAEAVRAAEAVETARRTAAAEREKAIALIEAAQDAEREATRIRVAAEADKAAAADRAEALREEATAEAEATKIRAAAKREDALAEAEGRRALVDAENAISAEIAAMKVQLARLEALPEIVAQMVKPAEKISSIKIHHVSGMGGATGGRDGAGASASGGAVNQAVDAIGAMAVQLPALRALGQEVGISLEDGLSGLVSEAAKPNGAATPPVAGDDRQGV